MLKKLIFVSLFTVLIFGCSQEKTPETFTEKVQFAHKSSNFFSHKAVEMDVSISFGGQIILGGKMTLFTDSEKGIISQNTGDKIYFDNSKIYYDSSKNNLENARFYAYTWPYFFLFPYKNNTLNGSIYLAEKLTFDAGTGDAPDDWYIAYADDEKHLLHSLAYIVTAGQTLEEAEVDPHAIVYSSYQEIEGIPIAHQWQFHVWREDEGLKGQLGEAIISNVKFLEPEADLFNPPTYYTEG